MGLGLQTTLGWIFFIFFGVILTVIFNSIVAWWDSLFDAYYESRRVNEIEGGENTGDGFINAAMFQDME